MNEMTVGDLRRQLAGLSDSTKITFHAGLTFYRFKRWSQNEIVLEFNEFEADLTPDFRQNNPDVLAVFIKQTPDGSTVRLGIVPIF